MNIEPFRMERWQSLHENQVEINLSESGVHPLSVRELLLDSDLDELGDCLLGYPQTNGSEALRGLVAAHYPGANCSNVLVTHGGAEANFISAWSLLSQEDEVVVVTPVYGQVLGLARSFAGETRTAPLILDRDQGRYRLDLDRIRALCTGRTRLIAICNPNNPTGARMSAAELDELGAIADRIGAWVLSDEIYRGAELDGVETASMWGRSERVIVTNGLSKAYGLPGLRVGWTVSDAERIEESWARHDYTTIAPTVLSDLLARRALEPTRRAALIERSRAWIRGNLPLVESFVEQCEGVAWIPPEAGAIGWLRCDARRSSSALAERLRVRDSLLVVPGDHFEIEGYLRVGFGGEPAAVERGLTRLAAALRDET